MKKLLLGLGIVFLFSPLAAQNIKFKTSEELKSGSHNPLLAIGEHESKIYMAHVGSGKKLSEYKVLTYDEGNIKPAPSEMEFDAI